MIGGLLPAGLSMHTMQSPSHIDGSFLSFLFFMLVNAMHIREYGYISQVGFLFQPFLIIQTSLPLLNQGMTGPPLICSRHDLYVLISMKCGEEGHVCTSCTVCRPSHR